MTLKPDDNNENYENNKILDSLVEKAIAGDKDALRDICEEMGRSIFFRAKYMLGNKMDEHDAADVSQEVFLRVCEKIGDLREPKAFKAWLNRIIVNEINRYARNKNGKGIVLNIYDNFDSFSEIVEEKNINHIPHDYVENNEFRKDLMGIILCLPIKQRQAILLYYYEDQSVEEIAAAMNVTQPNVSYHLTQARENIKAELEKQSLNLNHAVIPAALSFDTALSNAIQAEAINFTPSISGWLETALASCAPFFEASAVTVATGATGITAETIAVATTVTGGVAATTVTTGGAAAAVTATTTTVLTVVACALATCAIAASALFFATGAESGYIPMTGGNIVFSGGVDPGGNLNHINPGYAQLEIDYAVNIVKWWIETGDEVIVAQGNAELGIEEALDNLRQNGPDGAYLLFLRVIGEEGSIYRIGNSFTIRAD